MKFVFLDRDGTLIEESDDDKIDTLAKLAFRPGVFEGLRSLREAGYELVIVSNQHGVGRPDFSWESFDMVQEVFMKRMSENGIKFFDVFFCPHLLEDNCECRKPQIGLVKELLWECEMEADKSFMVGDRPTDVEFAMNLEVKPIFLKSARFPLDEELKLESGAYEADDFLSAVAEILKL